MGSYNPYVPQILGQEFVPIREENLPFSPAVNAIELGTSFRLDTARTVRDARFYTTQLPAAQNAFQTALVNIYPAGLEDLTGPIKQVIIPVSLGAVTGSNVTVFGDNAADAVAQPGLASKRIRFLNNAGSAQRVSFWFNVSSAGPMLANKRILNVSLLYAGYLTDTNALGDNIPFVNPDPGSFATIVEQRNDLGTDIDFVGPAFLSNAGSLAQLATIPGFSSGNPGANQVIGVLNLGDVNNFWDPTLAPTAADTSRMPWRYVDLLRFEPSFPNVNRQNIRITFQIPAALTNAEGSLDYLAMRVIYCEENRVAYGGKRFNPYNLGVNIITMRDLTFTADPSLAIGNYTATLSYVNPGEVDYDDSLKTGVPLINGLRELYSIPSHPGVEVDIPFPLADRLGDTFEKVDTPIHGQLTLHGTTGAPLVEPQVYGRQAIGQVYGTATVTQEIHDGLAGGSASWPWVRYIARRFGDTTVPLTLTGATRSVDITPVEFDALDEILDGWKEVTLRFDTAPTMGAGTQPQFVWSAAGEKAGNRWEILGASAPAVSGTPGNPFNFVPSTQLLSAATYGQPVSGAIINMGWIPQGVGSPWVTGTSDDNSSDAFIIFAQDMPTITGFAVTTFSQAITGIGQDCGVDPCCIPTDIVYNRITWPFPPNTSYATDAFERTVAAGSWGDADIGGTYTIPVGTAEFSVNGTQGSVVTTSSADRFAVLSVGTDFDVTVDTVLNNVVVGTSARPGAAGRYTDINNHYAARLEIDNAGTTAIAIIKRVAGVLNFVVGPVTLPIVGGSGGAITIRFLGKGSILKAKAWVTGEPEPAMWNLETTDTGLTTGSLAGVYIRDVGGTGNTYLFDNLTIKPPQYWFGAYELQRMDTVETDWQTIMLASSTAITGFNDYEARVGIESSYRIRNVDVYGFYGSWSSTVTSTIPAPGVSGGCLEDGHILIFTSNERQDGSINLAYSSVWMDQQVEENFTFPESEFVKLQAMYDRDFFTAFRPLERGGETFQRTVLVQAAAISPETLADFRSLRDMAWDSVSYICVRDEDGNRWLSTVIVPSGRVLRDRRLYLAPVSIIEVTDTPSPVDP